MESAQPTKLNSCKTLYLIIERPELTYYLSKEMPYPVRVLDSCLIDYLPEEYFNKYGEIPEQIYLNYDISKNSLPSLENALEKAFQCEKSIFQPLINEETFERLKLNFQIQGLGWTFHQLKTFEEIGKQIASKLEGFRVLIPVLYRPGVDYRPSILAGKTITSALQRLGLQVEPEFFTMTEPTVRVYPDFSSITPEQRAADVWVMWNGIGYDHTFLYESLKTLGAVFQVRSGTWDSLIEGLAQLPSITNTDLIRRYQATHPTEFRAFLIHITQILHLAYRGFSEDKILVNLQVEEFTTLYMEQIALMYDLRDSAVDLPTLTIMGNHPAMASAPVAFFGSMQSKKIVYFPHSKFQNLKLPAQLGTAICYPTTALRTLVESTINPRVNFLNVRYPSTLKAYVNRSYKLNTLGILLNKASVDGFHITSPSLTAKAILDIKNFTKVHAIQLAVRDKPFGTNLRYYSSACLLDTREMRENISINIDTFVKKCDLIILLDSPTSASADVLQHGIPAVQLYLRDVHITEAAILPALIPVFNLSQLLAFLTEAIYSEAFFREFGLSQNSAYIECIMNATTLDTELKCVLESKNSIKHYE